MCRTARNQILGFLGVSDIGGGPISGLVDDRTDWSLSETRKSELVGGPDMSEVQGARSLSFLGESDNWGSPMFGVVDISMWASDRCLGIFQSHSGLWNISAWESGGFLGFGSWWVAQMSLIAHGFPRSWQICRQLFRCSAGVFPCCCARRMFAAICH